MNVAADIKPDELGRIRRSISIQKLLEWAFADECASIDFEDPGTLGFELPKFGLEYVLLQRHELGCSVDGGGRSDPHHDADLVAAALAVLPESRGGRRMSVFIADLARARRSPDYMAGEQPQCVPLDWVRTQHGCRAKTAVIGHYETLRRRGKAQQPIRICPVHFDPSPAKIASVRRAYLDWYGALLDLKATFKAYNNLSSWVVTDEMPERTPWVGKKKTVDL